MKESEEEVAKELHLGSSQLIFSLDLASACIILK